MKCPNARYPRCRKRKKGGEEVMGVLVPAAATEQVTLEEVPETLHAL